MRVELFFDGEVDSNIYSQYCKYVYKKFQEDLESLVEKKRHNYKIREPFVQKILNLHHSIDLVQCIINSTELVNKNGIYVIRLNPKKKLEGVRVSLIVRLLEFGALGFQELPVLRRVVTKYNQNYMNYIDEFVAEGVVL